MALLNDGVGPILKESHSLVAIIPKLTFQSLSLTFESQKKMDAII
jgi:hypothetical protein